MGATRSNSHFASQRLFVNFLAAFILIGPLGSAQILLAHTPEPAVAPRKVSGTAPTVAEAEKFIARAETRLLELWIKNNRASWVSENFITDDTESIAADADQAVKAATAELAMEARRYEKLQL